MNNGSLIFTAATVYDDRPEVVEASGALATGTIAFISLITILFVLSYFINKHFNRIDYWKDDPPND